MSTFKEVVEIVSYAIAMEGVTILGLIVLIRTFLSMALQVELEGRWPWQRNQQEHATVIRDGDGAR